MATSWDLLEAKTAGRHRRTWLSFTLAFTLLPFAFRLTLRFSVRANDPDEGIFYLMVFALNRRNE